MRPSFNQEIQVAQFSGESAPVKALEDVTIVTFANKKRMQFQSGTAWQRWHGSQPVTHVCNRHATSACGYFARRKSFF
jgi:hypothetical protein